MPIQKTEFCDKRKAIWLKSNYGKVPYRIVTDYKYEPIDQLLKYLDKVIKSEKGEVEITYDQGKGITFGRHYAKMFGKGNGLQSLMREFRQTLACDDYIDIDIVNCQPTLLHQYCIKHNIRCKKLEGYVKGRDYILTNMAKKHNLSKADIKQEFINLIMGREKIRFELIESETLNDFLSEMKSIQEEVVKLNKRFYEYAKNRKDKEYNIKGSTVSYLLQDIENEIVLMASKFFSANGFKPDVLIFDGFMIRKDKNPKLKELDKYLHECNELIKREMGYEVKFIVKDMDDGYEITEEDLSTIDTNLLNMVVIESDREGADYILEKLNKTKDLIKCNGRYFLKINGNIYKEDLTKNNEDTKNLIMRLISNENICTLVGKEKEPKPYSKNSSGCKKIFDMVMCHIEEDKQFIQKMWDSNIRKLCFNDGYYDFTKKMFIFYKSEDIEYDTDEHYTETYSIVSVGRNYREEDEKTKKAKKWIYDTILEPIFWGDKNKKDEEEEDGKKKKKKQKKTKDKNNEVTQREHFLNWIARGIAGEWNEKTWAIGLGNRNSGKGVIIGLLSKAFGDYVGEFNSEDLICTKVGFGDTAKKMAWSVPFEFKRLSFSNEIKSTDEKGRKTLLDGKTIKLVASGGDLQTARLNFKDQIQFRIQGRMMLMMNELVDINPDNACETMVMYNFDTKFKNEITKEDIEIEQFGEYKYRQADPYIKEKINNGFKKYKDETTKKEIEYELSNVDIWDAMIHIVLENYGEPKKMDKEFEAVNRDMQDDDYKVVEQLKKLFVFKCGINDKIPVKEVDELIKSECPMIKKSQYKQAFKELGVMSLGQTMQVEHIINYKTKEKETRTERAYARIKMHTKETKEEQEKNQIKIFTNN